MNKPHYAKAAAELIRKYLPVGGGKTGDQARGVATIERALHARKRRRRLLAVAGVLVAAAAVVLVASLLKSSRLPASAPARIAINASARGKGAAVGQGTSEHPLGAHASLESGQRIETPAEGGASLQLSTGSSLDLSGRTSFRIDSQGAVQRFSLQQGEVSAHVAKLTSSQRFIVDTPDAEVEVRGTRFRLRVVDHAEACGAGSRTRLEVSEGLVEVRTSSTGVVAVKAGQSWPDDCNNLPAQTTPAQTPARTPVVAAQAPAHSGVPSASNERVAERTSTLTAANDLFAEGVARRRQGDVSGALRAYQEVLNRFPSSPLAENAMVERMRLLAGSGEGRAEAKRYLTSYPRGFALIEARKLLEAP